MPTLLPLGVTAKFNSVKWPICLPQVQSIVLPSPMKIVLLGTGGYFPTKLRHTACIMLPDVGVVLDAGTGMCQLGKHLCTDRLDIFLSHAHLDHIIGLTYLLNLVPPPILANTVVHGEEEKLAAVQNHLFANPLFPIAPSFAFQPLCRPCPLPQGGTLTYFPLPHPGGSLGFRLDWPGLSLAYVTDTTASASAPYLAAIRGVDLLLHEAYFAVHKGDLPSKTGHSVLASVAELAAAASPKRLILIHLDPQLTADPPFDLSTARKTFPNIEVGRDGDEICI